MFLAGGVNPLVVAFIHLTSQALRYDSIHFFIVQHNFSFVALDVFRC